MSRPPLVSSSPHDRPLAIELAPIGERGRQGFRLAVVLAAPGCGYARRTGGCRFCGFAELSTRGAAVSPEEYLAQADVIAEAVRTAGEKVVEVDLYSSGSFLADEEVPAAARLGIVQRLATLPGLATLLVESRPEHVTAARLRPLVEAAAGRTLLVGIGLESADQRVREQLMRKGFSLAAFERAAELVWEAGASLLVYALVKPAGLDEAEAAADAVATACYLAGLRRRSGNPDGAAPPGLRLAYQPAFVARGTALEQEYLAGRYTLLSLWTVVEVVRAAAALLPVQVALWDEGLAAGRVAAGCPACDAMLRRALAAFNASGDVALLQGLACPARGGCGG